MRSALNKIVVQSNFAAATWTSEVFIALSVVTVQNFKIFFEMNSISYDIEE